VKNLVDSLRRPALIVGGALALVAAAGTIARADVTPSPSMLRYPDISATQIVFLYANDLWIAPRDGGMAAPLASPPGAETFPRFSPDGKKIAFIGNYEGNRDIYTIGTGGGIPQRITHHPAGEALCDWTPDGRIAFISNGLAGLSRQTQMFTVGSQGGLPEKLPQPYSGFGSISEAGPDGTWVAFTPHSTDTRTWKRYRGGMATDVWVLNLKTKESRKLTDWEGTDTLPMWGSGENARKVFFLSDEGPEHRLNIWVADLATGKRERLTTFKDDDVRWPSIGPGPAGKGEIIFQLGASIRVLDLATNAVREVKITIPGDRPTIKPRLEDAAANLQGGSISPSGKRVVAVGRGDIWSLPVKEGVARNLTRTDDQFERDASWSPDGKWIAYFSDRSGEYELWLRASDAQDADAKKDDAKDGEKKDDAKNEDAKKEEPARPALPPTQLTTLGPGFRYSPTWSPDSKRIVFTDKAGALAIATLNWDTTDPALPKVTAEVKVIDSDPTAGRMSFSWSHDSGWLAYARPDEGNNNGCVWLYSVKTGEKTKVTQSMFSTGTPAFDRKGEFLYAVAGRNWNNPQYADQDTTFAYTGTEVLLMFPLREDVKHPFAPKSDEEEFKRDAKADKAKDARKDPEKKPEGDKKPDAKPDDGVSGTWEGSAAGVEGQAGGLPFSMKVTLGADGAVTARITSMMFSGNATGTFDKATGALSLTMPVGNAQATLTGTVKDGAVSGEWTAGNTKGTWNAKRTVAGADEPEKKDGEKKDEAKKDEPKSFKIDLEGFERRAIPLPLAPGNFGNAVVTEDNKLIFSRTNSRGGGGAEVGIKIFDPKDEAREEKMVLAGGAAFQLSANGKKLLVFRAGSVSVIDAAAGGGKSQAVSTSGLRVEVRPRNEWRQIFADAHRIMRDFFYEPTMHGVDWDKVRDHYAQMLVDCTTREDVVWVISEMISELNIGHAYIGSPGDVEGQPSLGVGLLGCDYELVRDGDKSAYRIAKVFEGGPWDSDARGPLSQPGLKADRVNVGDFLLAVNGVRVDTSKDPWAAFVGLVDRPVVLTVGTKMTMDEGTREVLVRPISSETNLRYRAWIENNRKKVADATDGKVGYIYVPNTGVDGQNDLFRQFFGQREKAALIIDERWNGGGQIPTRFIELLNRPVTNYWAKRDGQDWTWPPDSAQGHKCMLVNGLAGSGGDMFPWLFKHNKLGPVIGTRTWGGLVGISGNPAFIDGGSITVPTFGFYKTDGTWGVEGHGVDPDVEVIDDPAKMLDGGDPQLETAIRMMLDAVKAKPYTPPQRPPSPTYRSGMGIPERDR
jgi:tricorn protease